jgi:hypothetical protein
MEAVTEEQSSQIPRLPDNWHTVAQFA